MLEASNSLFRQQMDEPVSEGAESLLYFAARLLEEWSDDMVYSALLLHDDKARTDVSTTLLSLFVSLLTNTQITEYLHFAALVGVSNSYRVLERIQQLTTLDPNRADIAWWLDQEYAERIVTSMVENLSW